MRGRAVGVVLAALLVLLVGWAFAPALDNGFVNYDDNKYVTENPTVQRGLTTDGLAWAFDNQQTANVHPLTWLSHMLDVELFGLDPRGHHGSSLVLHALTAVLLFLGLARSGLSQAASWTVAALFAVHPLRVESVAWVAERKDVLCGVFFAACLWFHAGPRGRLRSAGLFACLLCGLAAKPMLVTLPCLLLLLDRWPLRRAARSSWYALVREKLPLFGLVIAWAALTLRQQASAGAVRGAEVVGLGARVANALEAIGAYVQQTFWPQDLAVFYPHPATASPEAATFGATTWLSLGFVLLASAACVLARRRRPELFVGWFWFLGMLVPVLGLVQVGAQARADRYTYLPSVGLFLAVVVTAERTLVPLLASSAHARTGAQTGARLRGPLRLLVPGLLALVLVAFGTRTRAQSQVWRSSETLFRHALAVTERNHVAHFSLGAELLTTGRAPEAVPHLAAAVAIEPSYANAHYNLGNAYQALGQSGPARQAFARASELQPDNVDAHVNLGLSLGLEGAFDPAFERFRIAAELAPEDPRVHRSLGIVARRAGRGDLARQAFSEALRLQPEDASAANELARIHEEAGRYAEARKALRTCLQARAALPPPPNTSANDPRADAALARYAWLVATSSAEAADRELAARLLGERLSGEHQIGERTIEEGTTEEGTGQSVHTPTTRPAPRPGTEAALAALFEAAGALAAREGRFAEATAYVRHARALGGESDRRDALLARFEAERPLPLVEEP